MAITQGIQDRELAKFKESSTTAGQVGVVVVNPDGSNLANLPRFTSYTGTITIGSAKSAGTLASAINGKTMLITQTVPNLTGTGTATTILLDATAGTIINLGTQAESTTITYGTAQPITTSMSWVSTADGTQAGPMNVVLTVHYEQ